MSETTGNEVINYYYEQGILGTDEYLDDESSRTTRVGKQKGNAPRDNQKQNEQVDSIANKLGLTKKQRKQLHDEVGQQGYSYKEDIM